MSDFPPVRSLQWVKWQAQMWVDYVRGVRGCIKTFWAQLPRLEAGIGSASFQHAASVARWQAERTS